MAKFAFDKRKTRKAAIAALCAVTVACTALAACQPSGGGSSSEDDKKKPDDTQLLSNGNFEFFTVPKDGVYLINNVNDWSRSGDSSGAKSGIVGTSENQWKALTAADLADKLDKNNDLSSSDKDYIDYNGMKSVDIPYRDTYAAKVESGNVKDDAILNKNDLTYADYLGIDVQGEDTKTYTYKGDTVYYNADDCDYYFDSEFTKPVRLDTVANPETHYGAYRKDGDKHYLGNKEIYVDDDGNYYSDEKKEYSEGNVLMIHNYPTDTKYNGIAQYFSSTTVNLPAHTAAKISLWVKTSDLKFDKGYSLLDEQDRGAFIEVVQTVGGTTIDNFTIKAINTEKIIADATNSGESLGAAESNGWLNYNIYVNACDFAESTVQLRLGLGKSDGETCTGYAFFDDVKVEKKLKIDDFTEYADSVKAETETNKTVCTLASDENGKIFYADKETRGASGSYRHSKHFNYAIDLASETGAAAADAGNHYTTFSFSSSNVTAGLTTEKEDNVTYASAVNYEGKTAGLTVAASNYSLYKKTEARKTSGDLLGVFGANGDFAATGIAANHSAALAGALLNGDNAFSNLPTYESGKSNTLVMLSANGAAYTSTVYDGDVFKLNKDECMIVSFWVKTSDMQSKTAATFTVYDSEDTEKKNGQTFNVDSTTVSTDIDDNKDIYNGWVQCFFFVQNNTKTDNKTFKIDFLFGNNSIISATSYDGGYAAVANLQTLKIPEKICNLTPTANFTKKFQFSTEENEKEKNKLSDATGTSDISKEIAQPDKYYGVNGGSSSVSDADYRQNLDVRNTHKFAGLINSDKDGENIPAHVTEVLKSFNTSATNWSDVFTDECYQPIIIVNTLRKYADKADATEDTFKTGNYYVAVDDSYSDGDAVEDNSGNKYRPVKDSDNWDDVKGKLYSFKEVCNYGFIGNDDSVDANGLKAVSVKVMVSDSAKAYVYLVDPDTREVLGYTAPNYTFHYDDEGNVLKAEFDKDWKDSEREENTLYELQDNGLYKDKDGKLHANLWNLKKIFLKDKFKVYYDVNGNEVRSSRFEDGVDYYVDSQHTKLAPHRLCNSEDKPIYEYTDEYDGGNPVYYYMVNGKKTGTRVENFDKQFARYDYTALNEQYVVEVGNTDGKWVTVNFVIKAGNKAVPFRVELWSGKRGESGVDGKTFADGAIAFDYSSCGITSSNYESVLRTDPQSYEKQIISKYQTLLAGHEDEFEKDGTIADYEKLAAKYFETTDAAYANLLGSYTAKYYTYSLYDDEAFIPYNKEVAKEGETGYDYTAPDSESLAYFKTTSTDGGETTYNVFADYSAVEQEIKYVSPDDSSDDGDDTTNANAGEFWLQLASILLVAVLLFVLIALVARNVYKKVKRGKDIKAQSKNVYKKRERYMRKLHIEEEETEEVENPALANSENGVEEADETEAPAEEQPETESEPEDKAKEAPEAEAPAEEPAADEAPAEEKAEADAENKETTENGGENKE